MEKDKEERFFVGLREPSLMRRAILEGSRDSLKILKISEDLKDIRTKKIEKIIQLKNNTKEINRLISKLKSDLPKVKIRIKHKAKLEVPKGEVKKVVTVVKKEKEKKHHKLTKLEKLESELGQIESKLGSLR